MKLNRRELLLGLAAAPAIAAAAPVVLVPERRDERVRIRFYRELRRLTRSEIDDLLVGKDPKGYREELPSWFGRAGDRFVLSTGVLDPEMFTLTGVLKRDRGTISEFCRLDACSLNGATFHIEMEKPGYHLEDLVVSVHFGGDQFASSPTGQVGVHYSAR